MHMYMHEHKCVRVCKCACFAHAILFSLRPVTCSPKNHSESDLEEMTLLPPQSKQPASMAVPLSPRTKESGGEGLTDSPSSHSIAVSTNREGVGERESPERKIVSLPCPLTRWQLSHSKILRRNSMRKETPSSQRQRQCPSRCPKWQSTRVDVGSCRCLRVNHFPSISIHHSFPPPPPPPPRARQR